MDATNRGRGHTPGRIRADTDVMDRNPACRTFVKRDAATYRVDEHTSIAGIAALAAGTAVYSVNNTILEYAERRQSSVVVITTWHFGHARLLLSPTPSQLYITF